MIYRFRASYQVSDVLKPDGQPPVGDDGGIEANVVGVHQLLGVGHELVLQTESSRKLH